MSKPTVSLPKIATVSRGAQQHKKKKDLAPLPNLPLRNRRREEVKDKVDDMNDC